MAYTHHDQIPLHEAELICDMRNAHDITDVSLTLINQLKRENPELFEIDTDGEVEHLDDGMDGDHQSALASIGWGTDEDYGYYPED